MHLMVTIQPTNHKAGSRFPTYLTEDGGVYVGGRGELHLIAASDAKTGDPIAFRIYAPGTWQEVNAAPVEE